MPPIAFRVGSPLGPETVGKLFVDRAGNYWRHVMYAAEPTATVERVFPENSNRPRVGGVVGSPILEDLGLRLLVPEDETMPTSSFRGRA